MHAVTLGIHARGRAVARQLNHLSKLDTMLYIDGRFALRDITKGQVTCPGCQAHTHSLRNGHELLHTRTVNLPGSDRGCVYGNR